VLEGTTTIFPVIPSRWSRHMKWYVPGAVDFESLTVNLAFESSQPLL
jgi:hypothetical protein